MSVVLAAVLAAAKTSWLVVLAAARVAAPPQYQESRRQDGTKGCKGQANAQPIGVRSGPHHLGHGTRTRQSSYLEEGQEVILPGRRAPSGRQVRRVLEPAEERDQRLPGIGRRVHDGAFAGVWVDLHWCRRSSGCPWTLRRSDPGRRPASSQTRPAASRSPGGYSATRSASTSSRTKQAARWSLTTPTACIIA